LRQLKINMIRGMKRYLMLAALLICSVGLSQAIADNKAVAVGDDGFRVTTDDVDRLKEYYKSRSHRVTDRQCREDALRLKLFA